MNSSTFDLDIDNYEIEDLQNFFNLKTVNSNDGDKIIFNKKDKNVK